MAKAKKEFNFLLKLSYLGLDWKTARDDALKRLERRSDEEGAPHLFGITMVHITEEEKELVAKAPLVSGGDLQRRRFLRALRDQARELARTSMLNESWAWARAYLQLAGAADVLEAFQARAEVAENPTIKNTITYHGGIDTSAKSVTVDVGKLGELIEASGFEEVDFIFDRAKEQAIRMLGLWPDGGLPVEADDCSAE